MTGKNSMITVVAALFIVQAAFAQDTLTLSGAIGRAMTSNYGVIIARAETEIASINNFWGNAGRYPTIGFDASENNSYDLSGESYSGRLSAGIGLNWILFDGFRIRVTKIRLENLESLSEGSLGVMIENTIEDVILGYYNVLLQQEQLAVLKTVMDLSSDRYRYELDRKSLGGSVTYDVLQAQNVFLTDKANFMNQEVVVRNAVRNLNFLMGVEPTMNWSFSESFEADTSRYLLSDLLTKMKNSNQVLKNQYTGLLLKQNETALSKSGYLPELSLSTGVDFNQSWPVAAAQSAANNGSFSPYGNLRLSYDIYSAGLRKRAVEVARINEEITSVEISQMEHALTNELFNLFDFYEVRIELLKVADENLQAAELNLSISGEKYRSGVINSFNYRDVQLIYLNAALHRLQAVYNLINSRTQLTRITGGFLGSDASE
jgi:outer membrane protein